MKKPRNLMQVPTGGSWKYQEPATGVTIEHNHWKAFLEKAFKHREANGLFTGSGWQNEVWHYVCLQNPQIESVEEGQSERRIDLSDVRRFGVTFSNWLGQGAQWVSQEEAERRAAICVSCPHNQVVNGCWGCKGPLNWIVGMLAGRRTSRDADLQQCEKCFCTLVAKVHIPLSAMLEGQEPVADLPEHCWMRDPAT
jgi:hypothetical protein